MKTFLRKLCLSLRAMFYGWIACTGVLVVPAVEQAHGKWRESLIMCLICGVYSALVILVACLFVFLPVDLMVPDQSWMRRPRAAALLGFIAGSCVPLALVLLPYLWTDPSQYKQYGMTWSAVPWLLSPGVTGMVAAWVRSQDGLNPSLP